MALGFHSAEIVRCLNAGAMIMQTVPAKIACLYDIRLNATAM